MNASTTVAQTTIDSPAGPFYDEPSVVIVPAHRKAAKHGRGSLESPPVIVAVTFTPSYISYTIKLSTGTIVLHFSDTTIHHFDERDPTAPPELLIELLVYRRSIQRKRSDSLPRHQRNIEGRAFPLCENNDNRDDVEPNLTITTRASRRSEGPCSMTMTRAISRFVGLSSTITMKKGRSKTARLSSTTTTSLP